jgi:hypothetical protein
MSTIDRRTMLRDLARGLAAGILAVTGAGLMATPPLEASPLPADKRLPERNDDLVQRAQAVADPVPRYRRRRRWVCWWHGRRRVCGWRRV